MLEFLFLEVVPFRYLSNQYHDRFLKTSIDLTHQIQNSNIIGISSGASAPEILVENFINDLKNQFTISIDEVEIIKENVVFKIPKKLN